MFGHVALMHGFSHVESLEAFQQFSISRFWYSVSLSGELVD
jgi:hypothetical protein